MPTQKEIENWFRYQAPTLSQTTKLDEIAQDAKKLALTIVANTPESADQTSAIRKLREVVYTANMAIASGTLAAAG